MSKLPTNPRPDEIVWWFKHGRRRFGENNIPLIQSVQDFEDKWIQWWTKIQPEWRDTENWPFPQDDATEEDWGHLLEGGKDGLFIVVVSLGWWIHARVLLEKSKVADAIIDVSWVITNIVSRLSTDVTTSNSPPAPSPTPQRKRTASTTHTSKQPRLEK